MSNTDSFIDEVTEEVRRDRLFRAFRRYGWIGVLVIAGIVGGSAYYEWQQSREAAESQVFGDALMNALNAKTPEERAQALAAVPLEGAQREVIRGFLSAAADVEAGRPEAALDTYGKIAIRTDLPPEWMQLALLKQVMLAGDKMSAADRGAALARLSAPGAPYRLLAQEQQALDLVAQNKPEEALKALQALLQEDGVTQGLRRRVSQLIVALGGQPQQPA